MSTSNRPRYHHGALKAALLDAADALLDEGGTGAVSLREAARRAGVTPAASYRHFPGKDDLLAALAVRAFEAFGDALGAAARGADDPVAAMGAAYVRFALARPGRFRLMFGPAVADRSRHPELATSAAGTFEQLVAAVERSGATRAEVRTAAIRAWALVHGLATLLVDGMLPRDDVDGLVRSVLAARRADSGPGAA